MAPKRRKKVGLTRMDAALDHMTSYGFSTQLVRKTVAHLLKLYGDNGWKFIEEDAYRVLLDLMIEGQETLEAQNLSKDALSTKLPNEDESVPVDDCAESSEPTPKESRKEKESLLDVGLDKNDLHSSPLHTDEFDDPPANTLNLQNSKNTPLSRRASVAVDTPVNVPTRRRKPCYGWISDDDNDDDTSI